LGDPTVPRRAGEVGACAALGNHIFTVSSGNKARDGDTLLTTKEAMVAYLLAYLGTTLGEETSKEFATGVTTVLTLPPQDPAILARHAARVLANTTRLNAKIVNLEAQQTAINNALAADPQDRAILREKSEVEDDLAKARFNLTEDLEMVLTFDEDAARKNAYHTYREDEQRLFNNRGKVYMLIIGQCTQALKDKLKEDVDWQAISDGYDSIRLMALIEKYVLKQTESHYPYLAVQSATFKHGLG
jgi:aryl carrier-like protein